MITTVIVLKDKSECDVTHRVMRKLKQMLDKIGYPIDEIAFTYAGKLASEFIADINPNIVATMGVDAFKAVYTQTDKPLGAIRGDYICTDNGYKLIPTFHPNYVYTNWANQETIEYDLRKVLGTKNSKKMPMRMGNNYSVCLTLREVQEARDYILKADRVAFDIETEGFDLFDNDEILCVQFSTRKGEGIVIPLRGAWARYETDYYLPKDIEGAEEKFVEFDDGSVKKVWVKGKKLLKPSFLAGSVVCIDEERHGDKGHICRGQLTNVWGESNTYFTGNGRMNMKPVPIAYNTVVAAIRDIMESDVQKVAHNGKFDVHGLEYQLGIRTKNFTIDTMLAYHQFHEERPHNLEFVRSRYTTMPKYDTELKSYLSPGKKGSFAEVPNEVLWEYGAADADLELRLVEPLFAEIDEDNPENGRWLFDNVDMPFNRSLTQIEKNGMLIDPARFDHLVKVYNNAITDLKIKLEVMCKEHKLTPLETWNNSNTLRPWLYETNYEWIVTPEKVNKAGEITSPQVTRPMKGLGMPIWGVPVTDNDELKTDKKAFTALLAWCAEDVLYTVQYVHETPVRYPTKQKLSERELKTRAWKREILNLILRYKQAVQARNLFLEGNPEKKADGAQAMLKHIRYDGRIHANYMQLTTTARTSTSGPNLANIANEDDEGGYFYGEGIRTMFTAPEDYDFAEIDYSSQEMRVLAYLADEHNLMDVFTVCQTCGEDFKPTEDDPERPFKFRTHREATKHTAQDLHTGTAAKVFKVDYDKVTKQQRTFAKRVNFGLNYGQGVRGLAQVLGISLGDAQLIIDDYMAAFPGIRIFQANTKNKVYRGKKIANGYGRWRHNYGVKEMKAFMPDREYEKQVAAKYRGCVNYPVQSTPADILANVVIALTDVWGLDEDWENVEAHALAYELCGFHPAKELAALGARCVNLVYDSTQWNWPRKNRDRCIEIITMVSEGLPWLQLGYYLPVDVTVGPYWGYKEAE